MSRKRLREVTDVSPSWTSRLTEDRPLLALGVSGLLLVAVRGAVVPDLLRSTAQANNAASASGPSSSLAGLGVDDAHATVVGHDEVGVLCLETSKVLLGIPVPPGVGREQEIHFFQGALVGLWVECPHDRNGDDVRDAEHVEGLFLNFAEHDGQEQDLRDALVRMLLIRQRMVLTVQPLPILHPTTPQALPLARH